MKDGKLFKIAIAAAFAVTMLSGCMSGPVDPSPASASMYAPRLNHLIQPAVWTSGSVLSASAMPKWRSMKARQSSGGGSGAWQAVMRDLRSAEGPDLLAKVNQRINRFAYVDDRSKWGSDDYWASPAEFASGHGGDCEDFAIAKYFALSSLGVPRSDMMVLVTREHAVLVVSRGGKTYVLDNRRQQPYPLTRWLSSQAVYAINGTDWWVRYRA